MYEFISSSNLSLFVLPMRVAIVPHIVLLGRVDIVNILTIAKIYMVKFE